MSDLPATPRRHNRASWVALRTLRQVPKVVGETKTGAPVFEVRSVRLVLPEEAHHFSRLVACSKCGREVPGPAVLSPADLDHAPHPVICKECVRAATGPASRPARASAVAPEPLAPDPAPANGAGNGHVVEPRVADERRPADERRVAALEEQASDLAAQLAAQRTEWEVTLDRRLAEAENGRLAALENQATDFAAQRTQWETSLDRRVQETVDGRVAALEDRARERAAQRSEWEAALDQRVQEAVDRRLAALEERASDLAAQRTEWETALDRRLQETVDGRMAALEKQAGDLAGQLAAQRTEWEATLDRRLQEGQAELTSLGAVLRQVAEVQEQRGGALEDAVGRLERSTQADAGRIEALEQRIEEAVERSGSVAESDRAELRATLDAQVAALQAALEEQGRRTGAAIADVAQGSEQQVRVLDERLERLQAGVDAAADPAAVEGVKEDLGRIERQLHDRLERRAEREARAGRSERERVEALESQVQDAVDRVAHMVDEVRSEVTSSATHSARRFEGLEEQAVRRTVELADLGVVQAALDEGMGDLRAEIVSLREVTGALAARQQEIDSTVVELADPRPLAAARRGLSRRSADASDHVSAVSTATDDLIHSQKLQAQIAMVEQAVDEATTASARAMAKASGLTSLRKEVKALQEQLGAQNEALESLRKSVDRLRRKVAAPPDTDGQRPKRATKRTTKS